MEVNSGKSIQYSLFMPFTLKYNMRALIKRTITKQK